ncbi:hypothetical protein ACN27F_03460 [Solwaraspora sp. WMMB335]|uniref:hypothetical protein n=1 Tax=Solwaraspora sp. WMMB335 TaxID=3404118 RepID=UPI003B93BB38
MPPYLTITPTRRGHRPLIRTPITTLRHPDTHRAIVVVSTIHYAEPAYYHQLLDDITTHQQHGFTVHHEGAQYRTPGDEPTDAEQDVLAHLTTMRETERLRMTALGWTYQPTLLHHPTWQRRDMTDLDIIRAAGTDAMLTAVQRRLRLLTWPDEHVWRHAAYHAWFALANRAVARAARRPTTTRRPHRNPHTEAVLRVLTDQRTTLAVTAATDTTDDLVMIWGAAHLPGITTALHTHGYQLDTNATRWRTAGHLPPLITSAARYLLRRPPAPHPHHHTRPHQSPE